MAPLMHVSGQLHASAALLPGRLSLVSIRQGPGWAPQPLGIESQFLRHRDPRLGPTATERYRPVA
jgi:hypothetical protein